MAGPWEAFQAESPVKITVNPAPKSMPAEGFTSNPRGYSTDDVGAAVRGDMFNSPGMPIKYAAQPGQTFGVDATRNAKPFEDVVAHHTGGPTLQGALNSQRDPFTGQTRGYHFYIDTDGTVVQGAPMDARTNHVQPPNSPQRTARPDISNNNSVGVSFVGNSSNPTPEQLAAAENLTRSLMDRYGIQPQNVVGHGQIQGSRQPGEGMPLVAAIQNQQQPAVARGFQAGGVANAALPQPSNPNPKPGPWAAFQKAEAPQPESRPDIGRGRAALEGLRSGALFNFGDEIAGAQAASGLPSAVRNNPILAPAAIGVGAARLGLDYLTGRDEATGRYVSARDEVRRASKAAEEQYPGTYLAGNVGGAIAVPVGGMLNAATIPARLGRSAAVGAAAGGLSGAGEGTTLPERAIKGATGVAAGGVLGAAAVPALGAVELAARGAGKLVSPITSRISGAINPEGQAARSVVRSIERDAQKGGTELSPQEFGAAKSAGVPVSNAELGGETTRALARWAANVSPEARATIQGLADSRFEGQTERAIEFLQKVSGTAGDTSALKASLKAQSSVENAPAYAKAYNNPAARGMWDEGFEQIAQAPVVQNAIRAAGVTAGNRGTIEGLPRIQSPFVIDRATGGLTLRVDANGNRVLPNLQFWDHVKRNLDKIATPEARTLNTALKEHLDDLVPAYKDARAGAAKFFGADNAIDAGVNFVHQNMAMGEVARALAKMSPADREMFKVGFIGKLVDDLGNVHNRQNVLRQIGDTKNAADKLKMVLGPNGHNHVAALVSVEKSMDKLRGALGNSTTARQIIEYGLVGGLGGAGAYNLDPSSMGIAAAIAGKRYVDGRVARHIADMLVSSDPGVLAKGIRQVAGNKNLLTFFRDLDAKLSNVSAQQAPAVQIPGIGRADDQQPAVPRPVN